MFINLKGVQCCVLSQCEQEPVFWDKPMRYFFALSENSDFVFSLIERLKGAVAKYFIFEFYNALLQLVTILFLLFYISNNHYGHFAPDWKRKQTFTAERNFSLKIF